MFNPNNNESMIKMKQEKISKDIEKLKNKREFLIEREAKIVSNMLRAKDRLSIKEDIKNELDLLQNKTQEKSIGLFTKLLSNMVHDVMPKNKDQNVFFNLTTKRGKPNLDIMMQVDHNKFEDVNSGRGGSLTNVISTGLRYVTLSRTKNRRFMLLDEPDCWLEDNAVPRFAKVVSDISRKVGIQTIAISHKNPDFYNSRMIKIYRDEDGDVKAKVIQEAKEDNYIDNNEYDDINRTSLMDDIGIKRIKIKNYMSLSNIDVELSPTMNMIVGENDIGKSAFFSAIRSFVDNECNESMIQHDKDFFSVEMEIEDGIVIKLIHKRKGQKKTTYQMIMPDGETISEDNGRDVPDFISDALAIKTIDGINIQLAHQKTPVFMIGPDITSSKRAELLSLGRESDYIQKMINLYNEDTKEDALIIKNGQKELDEIRISIETLEPIIDIEKSNNEMINNFESISILKSKEESLISILETIESNQEALLNLDKLKTIVVPNRNNIDINDLNILSKIMETGLSIKKNNDIINKANKISQIVTPIAPTIRNDNERFESEINMISESNERIDSGRKKYKNEIATIKEIEKEKDLFISEVGGICPLCNNNIKHEHKQEKIMSSKHQEHIIAVFSDKYNELAKKKNVGNIYSISELSEKRDISEAFSKSDIIIAQRETLEKNTGFRQLIPYVSLVTEDGKFLTYTRTKKGNENRLHKKISVGFGGHMDATDTHFNADSTIDVEKTIFNGLNREVIEELGEDVYDKIKDQIKNFKIEEMIIDDKTEVEQVHLALLIKIVINKEIEVISEDESITIEGFLKAKEIKELNGDIEPWSEIVINK